MDFWRTLLVLLRRWYIAVPAFVLTIGLAGAAYSTMPVQYQSSSVLVLTTPLTGGTEGTRGHPNPITNPLLSFDQSLSLTASIVIQQMNSLETIAQLGLAPGDTTSYQVTNGSTNPELLESGPFIFIQGTAPSPEAATAITTRVAALAAKVLAERQTELNAPESTHISVQTVAPATAGQVLAGSRKRAAAAAMALGIIASLASVYGYESMVTRRRGRGSRRHADGLTGPGVDPMGSGATATSILAARSTPSASTSSPRLVRPAAPPGEADGQLQPSGASRHGALGLLEVRDGPHPQHSQRRRLLLRRRSEK
jgi:hypothetical protein